MQRPTEGILSRCGCACKGYAATRAVLPSARTIGITTQSLVRGVPVNYFPNARRSRVAREILSCGLAVVCVAGWCVPGARGAVPNEPQRVIIDTDPGTDDALALLLAFNSPELQVEAVTVVAGNVTADMGLDNALRITNLAGKCDVPVAKGAAGPLTQKLNTEEFWNGANGVGGAELPATRCEASSSFGPDLIIQLVHQFPHLITLIPIGPLTNIALAVSKDRTIVPLVKEVVLMGGSITGGNVNAASEFNIHSDPEAASVVFNAGWPLVMVGLDVTEHTLITNADVARLESKAGPETKFAAAVARFQIGTYQGTGFGGGAIHDALAVGAVIDPSFLKTKAMRVDIELVGKFTRGATVANRQNAVDRVVPRGDRLETVGVDSVEPNVQVAIGVDSQRFIHMVVERISGK